MDAFGNKFARAVEEARANVATAFNEYRRGGSVDKINAANSKLAQAHFRWSEWSGDHVPDDRDE